MTDGVSSLRLRRDRARRRSTYPPRWIDNHGGACAHARVALWLVWLALAGCAPALAPVPSDLAAQCAVGGGAWTEMRGEAGTVIGHRCVPKEKQ